MIQLLITWAALTVGVFVAAKLLKGFRIKGDLGSHLIVSAIFGALVVLTGWFLSAVIVIGTFGLGALVPFLVKLVVMTILLVVTDMLTDRLTIKDFGTAVVASLIVAIVGAITEFVLGRVL